MKKCTNCEHQNFCQMYLNFVGMAGLLNTNLRSKSGGVPFVLMVNFMADMCHRFEAIEEE